MAPLARVGDPQLYRTRYGLLPRLGQSGEVEAARYGANGGGFLGEQEAIDDENRKQHATIAGLAEVLAPEIAKRRGITEEEAARELTGGVADREGSLHWLGRQTLGRVGIMDREGPQGEPIAVRQARLGGMLVRSDREIAARKAALATAQALYPMKEGVSDPEMMSGPTATALREAGANLPADAPFHLRRKTPDSVAEMYAEGDKEGALALASLLHPGGSEKQDQVHDLARALVATGRAANMEEATVFAYQALQEKGGEPRITPAEGEFARFTTDQNQQLLAAEQLELQQWKAEGSDPDLRPETPLTEQYDRLKRAAEEARSGNTRGTISRLRPSGAAAGELNDFFDAVEGGAQEDAPLRSPAPGQLRPQGYPEGPQDVQPPPAPTSPDRASISNMRRLIQGGRRRGANPWSVQTNDLR